jgi:hypothetical protein
MRATARSNDSQVNPVLARSGSKAGRTSRSETMTNVVGTPGVLGTVMQP